MASKDATAKPQAARAPRFPILHPVFFAVAPIVGLLAGNRDHVDPGQAVLPVLLLCVALGAVQLALGRALRGRRRGALAASGLVFLFFYAPALVIGSWAGALGVVVTVAVGIALLRGPGEPVIATRVLEVAASVLLALQLGGLLYARAKTPMPAPRAEVQAALPRGRTADAPNFYHIVLDGYGREDVLEDVYGIERPLAAFLRARGFFVAARAHANYPQTAASLASALNLAPVQDLFAEVDAGAQSRLPLKRAIGSNRLARSLRAAGYEIVEIPTDYSFVALATADRRLAPALHFTELDHALLTVSGLAYLPLLVGGGPGDLSFALHRRHLLHTLDALPEAAGEGPTYVFAHLLAPHPPFVFRADGSPAASDRPFAFADGDHWVARARRHGEDYIAGYRGQTLWLDARLREAVGRILERDPGAVILLHSDHGPGARLHWDDPRTTDLRERMGILLAVRWAGGDYASLYPTMTLVNGVRAVLDHVLGAALPRLEDRVWFSTWDRPYAFIDVTARLDPTAGER